MSKSLKFTLKQILQQHGVAIIICIALAIINTFTARSSMYIDDYSLSFTDKVMVGATPVNSHLMIFLIVAVFSFIVYATFISPWIISFTGPYDRFETHIRLGNTRRSYIISEIVADILNIVIIQLILLIIYGYYVKVNGQEALSMEWVNTLKRGIFNYDIILPYLCYAMTARWLGALTYRFGGKLWLTLLVVAVLSNIFIAWLLDIRFYISDTMGQIIAWVYVVAAVGVTIVSMLKQDIRGNK